MAKAIGNFLFFNGYHEMKMNADTTPKKQPINIFRDIYH